MAITLAATAACGILNSACKSCLKAAFTVLAHSRRYAHTLLVQFQTSSALHLRPSAAIAPGDVFLTVFCSLTTTPRRMLIGTPVTTVTSLACQGRAGCIIVPQVPGSEALSAEPQGANAAGKSVFVTKDGAELAAPNGNKVPTVLLQPRAGCKLEALAKGNREKTSVSIFEQAGTPREMALWSARVRADFKTLSNALSAQGSTTDATANTNSTVLAQLAASAEAFLKAAGGLLEDAPNRDGKQVEQVCDPSWSSEMVNIVKDLPDDSTPDKAWHSMWQAMAVSQAANVLMPTPPDGVASGAMSGALPLLHSALSSRQPTSDPSIDTVPAPTLSADFERLSAATGFVQPLHKLQVRNETCMSSFALGTANGGCLMQGWAGTATSLPVTRHGVLAQSVVEHWRAFNMLPALNPHNHTNSLLVACTCATKCAQCESCDAGGGAVGTAAGRDEGAGLAGPSEGHYACCRPHSIAVGGPQGCCTAVKIASTGMRQPSVHMHVGKAVVKPALFTLTL